MNIAFDLDGVIYPWHEAVHTYLRTQYGESVPAFEELWKDPYKYFSEEKWKFIATIPLLYSTRFPRPDIVLFLQELDRKGHTLYYITNRNLDLELTTLMYLNSYNFPQTNNLIHTSDKVQYIRILELDVIVDDRPELLEKFSSICTTYGVSQPYNKSKREYLESIGVIFVPAVECLRDILC